MPHAAAAKPARLRWQLVVPVVLLQLLAVAPLVGGRATLYLRDVLNTHYEMQSALVQSGGSLPLIDPYRGGGQPLAGNPNALGFYPTRLLYRVASPWWALNAHFWLHFLLAPWTVYAMARSFGLGRPAAWASGTTYAWSGYFLSQMSHYNLVAGATLAPLLVALVLRAGRDHTATRAAAGAGLTWALLLLAGEPSVAAMALLMALVALGLSTPRPSRRAVVALTAALACGLAVAWPQLAELLRILGSSQRPLLASAAAARGVGSFDPRQAVELLLPLFFGRPDRVGTGSFWGHLAYQGDLPLFFSLAPGVLTIVLLAAAGRGRCRGGGWAWVMVAGGLALALGRANPIVAGLWSLGAATWLRFPIKLWLWVATGLSLLAGIGFERLFDQPEPQPRRRAMWMAGALGISAAGVMALARIPGAGRWLAAWLAAHLGEAAPDELGRWTAIALLTALCSGAYLFLARLAPRPGRLVAVLALTLHAASQLQLLSPLLASDDLQAYLSPPPAAAALTGRRHWVHGSFGSLFGPSALARDPLPDEDARWLARRAHQQLYPFLAPSLGLHMELNGSPEGLDTLLTRLAAAAVRRSDDVARLRLLRTWGVEGLILDRPLDAEAPGDLLYRGSAAGGQVFLYGLREALPEVRWVPEVAWAPDPESARSRLTSLSFDPAQTVVLAGSGAPLQERTAGALWVRSSTEESLQIDVESAAPGVVVVERSHLPLWRAMIDDRSAVIEIANLHRMAVLMPPGRHRLRLWIDRRPLQRAAWLALGGLAGLLGLSWRRAPPCELL